MIVGVAGILPLSCPVGADGAAAWGLGERSGRRLRGSGGRESAVANACAERGLA